MEDTGSLRKDVRRKPNKSSKVNRIVSLFEISRPNKQRAVQRTNSLPATKRVESSSVEDQNRHTQTLSSLFGNGRVKKIKEELEEKSKSRDSSPIPIHTVSRKKERSKRRKFVSEGNMDDILQEEKKEIIQNLVELNKNPSKIEVVTEDIEQSDTELEIAFNEVGEDNDDTFQDFDVCDECENESSGTDKVTNEAVDTAASRLSSDTITNRLSSDFLIENHDANEERETFFYGENDFVSGTSYFKRTSGETDYIDRLSQGTDTEDEDDFGINTKFLNNDTVENETIRYWWQHRHKYEENNDTGKEVENNDKVTEENSTQVDSIAWWKKKSFVQINNGTSSRQDTNQQREDDGCTSTNSESSSTNTPEKRRRFIKNNTMTQSQRNNRRRTGILLKSQSVKDLAKHFESFKDAAEQGETEIYRRSFIDEMDKELENMKKDGFKDNFHLSFENLAILDDQGDIESINEPSNNELKELDIDTVPTLDEESSSYFQTKMFISNALEEKTDFEDMNSSADDDLFGETLFSEDLEHGLYYVETYNADGKELIMCTVQVDRRTVDLNKLDEVKSRSESKLLAQQDDEKTLVLMGNPEANTSQLSLDDSNTGTDSKRTTIYSTTSGDSFDDRVTDDEGIDIENSSSNYGYSGARRETYCDDQGVVRIERIAPYTKNVEENPEYLKTNYYYDAEIEPVDEEEEDYYQSICLEHEITFCVPEVKKDTLQYIVEEIKATERKYVDDMRRVLEEYKTFLERRSPDYVDVVFGNMETIYLKQTEFLKTLNDSKDELKDVVQAFIDYEDLFRLYPRYFRNTPKANTAVKELAEVIKEKQEQLNDKLHLSAYLLTPLQRLGKYKLFLENITKQLKKEDKPSGSVQIALDIIKKYMSRGNDAVAVASILHSPLHPKDYGSFVAREKFALIKPKKIELMVFLFQEVVIFTTEDQRNMEQFIYWKSIKTEDLRIATYEDTTIHLTDYTKTKSRLTSKHTFVLDAKTQKLKIAWKHEIEEILWKQLKKVKENTLKEYQSGKKLPKKPTRNRIKSTGTSVFYIE